ncbi:MAG TPA: DNA glycosylase, partial [Candidatus Paceibacterota bacterium]|nr:DNA glycosylase [Candidatus Paceibacterota bacterium]
MIRHYRVEDYHLAATLSSGQAFRWRRLGDGWEGVIGGRWVLLRQAGNILEAMTAGPCSDWEWLERYLQLNVRLCDILRMFPKDILLQEAVRAWRGLRLLRQDPWECLASFLLSSNKQITQIEQIVSELCGRWGDPVLVPPDHEPTWSFPAPERLACRTEGELRACKMGFRAPYLLEAARQVREGKVDIGALSSLDYEAARQELLRLKGVGEKIADCVLLFSVGFLEAFPVDVWIRRELARHFFSGRCPSDRELRRFIRDFFGPAGGYAQQYLFHHARSGKKTGA